MMTVVTLTQMLLIAAPAPAPAVVLDCYVTQSSQSGVGQFVRHIELRPESGVVAIADSLGGASPRFVGNGRLVSLDADRIVYDFASASSAGRTEIDRRTGVFYYNDGRSVVRGTCQQSAL